MGWINVFRLQIRDEFEAVKMERLALEAAFNNAKTTLDRTKEVEGCLRDLLFTLDRLDPQEPTEEVPL